ncbi:MAG: molybdenum cofactor guanylyltransferase [Cyanobacteriota bacterium]|nr:molybdenum cofactor guanylyltransferase [Cyanobacteriota bacterium]
MLLDALILAGGESSRMGSDKALLDWQGEPMLRWVARAAASCCEHIYVLTTWAERYQAIADDDWIFLPESQTRRGALLAFAEGFHQIMEHPNRATTSPAERWVLLLACDLPRLDPSILRLWSQQIPPLSPTVQALVPWRSGYWDPLCGFYRFTCHPSLAAFVEAGGRSFQRWLEELPAHPLHPTDLEALMLWNCNYPADLILPNI